MDQNEVIQDLIELNGGTASDLAENSRLSRPAVSYFLNYQRRITFEAAMKLAGASDGKYTWQKIYQSGQHKTQAQKQKKAD